jgi:hypothetical protein
MEKKQMSISVSNEIDQTISMLSALVSERALVARIEQVAERLTAAPATAAARRMPSTSPASS